MKPKNKLSKYQVLAEPEFGKAKRIKTWINGGSHCYVVSINPKDFRSWPPILNHISRTIQPNFGAIKKLLALSTLQSVHSFEELDPKEKYIALGAQCKFTVPPGGYGANTDRKISAKPSVKKLFYVGELNPKSQPFLNAMSKKKLTVVYIAISGRTRPPQKVIFSEQDMKDWNLIRNYLAKILGISEGVQFICTIYGDILCDGSEFQHGYLYVVVPFTQTFIQMDYINLSNEKSVYRKNFMTPCQPTWNVNSFKRGPGLEKKPLPECCSLPITATVYEPQNKLRPKKDTVTEERQRVFYPPSEPYEEGDCSTNKCPDNPSETLTKTFSKNIAGDEKSRVFNPASPDKLQQKNAIYSKD